MFNVDRMEAVGAGDWWDTLGMKLKGEASKGDEVKAYVCIRLRNDPLG